MVANEAQPALGLKPVAVERHDAGGFLAAMLQGVKAECGQRGGVCMAIDAKHAAFFTQAVSVEVEIELHGHWPSFCPKAGWSVAPPVPWMRFSRP